MSNTFSRVRLTQAVREYLTEFIIENNLGPGDSLPPETHLAQELDVGRSSVREAVKALQALGVVEARQGDGLYVREYNLDPILKTLTYQLRRDPKAFAETLQIRVWLETAVVGEAVKEINEDRLRQLEECLEEWSERVRASQPYAQQDRQFHRILHGTLDNSTLTKLLDVFWLAFEDVGSERIKHDPDPVKTLRDHRAILKAVQSGDEELARQNLRQSFSDIRERVGDVLNQSLEGSHSSAADSDA